MAVNRGKQFEKVVQEAFEKVPDVSIDRLHDQTTGYRGSSNICDFVVYRKPFEYYIECKSVHGNTLSISSIPKPDKQGVLHDFHGNITDTQWEGLVDKSNIKGVVAGILCWWIDRNVTKFIPISVLQMMYENGYKSINYNLISLPVIELTGKKKRVFFEYDMNKFLQEAEKWAK